MERVRSVARQGTTVILVTHHLEEIIPEIERVVLLRAGRIAGDGPKAEMLASARLSRSCSNCRSRSTAPTAIITHARNSKGLAMSPRSSPRASH